MDKPRSSSAAVIFAIGLLLLPVLYVGSYSALVKPPYDPHPWVMAMNLEAWQPNYRFGGRYVARIFWLLE